MNAAIWQISSGFMIYFAGNDRVGNHFDHYGICEMATHRGPKIPGMAVRKALVLGFFCARLRRAAEVCWVHGLVEMACVGWRWKCPLVVVAASSTLAVVVEVNVPST